MEKIKKLFVDGYGKYYLENRRVTPILVYGPIAYEKEISSTSKDNFDVSEIVGVVREERGINLEEIADSFTSAGVVLNFPGEIVPDGRVRAQKIQTSIISFFKCRHEQNGQSIV
jgi:hypothetical protein